MPPSLRISCALLLLAGLVACNRATPPQVGTGRVVQVDGSSTVFPISRAVVSEFERAHPDIPVTVTFSGTGGGFQRFCRGEIDIGAAARPIRRAEIEACLQRDVRYIELPIAYDAIAIVVNPKATWINDITVSELRTLWAPDAQWKVTRWSQVRQNWPNREIHLYGPGIDSGTYDYFTAAVVGAEGSSRGDFNASEDDHVVSDAVAQDELALGVLPLAYWEENRQRLKVVPLDNQNALDGAGPVTPSRDSIRAGTYQPLARPVFIYVREQALNRPGVPEFVDFYLEQAGVMAQRVGFMQLSPEAYRLVVQRRKARWTGTAFDQAGSQVGLSIEQLLDKSRIP